MNNQPGATPPADLETRRLTHMQLLIWTGQQLDPKCPIYNSAFQIRIATAIDESVFRRAFCEIVARSETLRTTVEMSYSGEPQVRLVANADYEFPSLDFSQYVDPVAEARRWCQHRCERLLPMNQLMFDAALIKLGKSDYVWYINQHHLICDAWGVTQLFRLQTEFYDTLKSGESLPAAKDTNWVFVPDESNPKPSPSIQSASPTQSIVSANFYGANVTRAKSLSDRVSVFNNAVEKRLVQSQLAAITGNKLARSFSKQLGLFNVVLTLLYSYLHRSTGQQAFCIGVPFHNRLTPAAKESMGPFISFHPVEVEFDVDETFATLLRKVQTATNVYLKNATSGNPASNSNSTFNVVCNFIHANFRSFESVDVDPHWLHPGCHDAEHHLRLHAGDFNGSGEVDLNFDFNCSVFDADKQQDAIVHFRKLIHAMAEKIDQPIGSVDLLSDSEKQLLDEASNAQHANESSFSSEDVLVRFEAIALHQPNATALQLRGSNSIDEPSVTYQQLAQRVTETANHIASRVSGGPTRIAVCLTRSMDAVVAMLAVLKTRHAFVPIDPGWPEKRKQFIYSDGQIEWAFDRKLELSLVSTDVQKPVQSPVSGSNLPAYILYTSGSTGQPKGVEISRSAMAAYIGWASDYYCGNDSLAFPLFTPLTFDLTLTSVFVPLVSGGRVVIYPPRSSGADLALLDVVEDNLVNIIKLTPSHLSLLANRRLPNTNVRQLILGGEDLKTLLVNRIASTFSADVLIHNEYGPTEVTVGCIVHSAKASERINSVSVPIGRPIGNMRAYILNDRMQKTPVGVVGDLYLAGNQLATGYFGRLELTNSKFSSNPFANNQGSHETIYQTGDLARINAEGFIEFLGRRDQQVKIRGARIELGAVETALASHSAISDAVVTTYGTDQSQPLDFCFKCGLASNYPGATFNADLVCNQCQAFESYRENAQAYFKPLDELGTILREREHNPSRNSEYDCISLLSGGKDSSYMLGRLADMGLKVLAFTLDNGFISEEAKANIRRVVETLNVDHLFGTTPAMNEIFVDSLKRHANVCQGCFKTIYTLGMNLANKKNVPFIVTGLSRGQFFETRLTEELFKQPGGDLVQIDQTVLDARQAYHRIDDAVYRNLDVKDLQGKEIFTKVRILDFYRYCDVDLDEMYEYLDRRLPWVRPSDTGRSTNCLINDVGIYVHQRRMGFHNYALPYSWDVRLGHKQREAALDELDDNINVDNVHQILNEIGYDGDLGGASDGTRLVGFYVAPIELPHIELMDHLKEHLPVYMLPSRFVRLDKIPLSVNGKIDTNALPDPTKTVPESNEQFVAPQNETESKLATIWAEVLGCEKVGIRDRFFDMGGDSILAIQIVARSHRVGITITPSQFFETLTIEKLAARWQRDSLTAPAATVIATNITNHLTPIQTWMLQHELRPSEHWNQAVTVWLPFDELTDDRINVLRRSLATIVNHHASLRTSLSSGLPVTLDPVEWATIPCEIVQESGLDFDKEVQAAKDRINTQICHSADHVLGAIVVCPSDSNCRLWLAINHSGVDAVSFQLLLLDLQIAWEALIRCQAPALSTNPTYAQWSDLLLRQVQAGRFDGQLVKWQQTIASTQPPKLNGTVADSGASARRIEWTLSWDAIKTKRLRESLSGTRVNLDELLLVALARTLASKETVSGNKDLRIFVERHGRESIDRSLDFSQTVGWFTNIVPLNLSTRTGEFSDLVRQVKDQLRATPHQTLSYGALSTYSDDEKVSSSLRPLFGREVLFNYLGRQAGKPNGKTIPFKPTGLLELHRSESIKPFAALEVNAFLSDVLTVNWSADANSRTEEQLAADAKHFFEHLGESLDYILGDGADDVAASDFPMAALDSSNLQNLAALLGKKASKDEG